MVLEWTKHDIGVSFLSSAKHNVLEKGYIVMEPFADHIVDLVPLSCFTALDLSNTVTHTSLADLFRLALQTFDCIEALKGEEARHF